MSAEAQKPIEDDDQEIIIEQEEEVSDDVEETASSAPETEPDDNAEELESYSKGCLLYTSPSPRDVEESRMPSSA